MIKISDLKKILKYKYHQGKLIRHFDGFILTFWVKNRNCLQPM